MQSRRGLSDANFPIPIHSVADMHILMLASVEQVSLVVSSEVAMPCLTLQRQKLKIFPPTNTRGLRSAAGTKAANDP